jgi:hypothetical protein
MKTIHEMRRYQLWQAHRNDSPLPIILGAVIAFGNGILGISGLVRAPDLFPRKIQTVAATPVDNAKLATVVADASIGRIGHAEAAPLLKVCVPFAKLGLTRDASPAEVYRVLQSGNGTSRIAARAGLKQTALDEAQFAAIWAQVADCVYRQEGFVFCDPDNRAFAVEATNAFMRQPAIAHGTGTRHHPGPMPVSANADQRGDAAQNGEIQNVAAVKARVFSGLRMQVADGRLNVSDFGLFAPHTLVQIVRDTKVARDACSALD